MSTATTRIFLVDRRSLVREALRARLCAVPGFQVIGETSTLAQMLASPRAGLQVLITDIRPEELGPLDLHDVVRQAQPAATLVLSWESTPALVAHAMKAGAKGFMLKDASATQLVEAVSVVAAGGMCIGAGISGASFSTAPALHHLTRREREILALVGQGVPNKLIARQLALSLRTVESHRQNIKKKLDLETHAAMIRFAIEHGSQPPVATAEPQANEYVLLRRAPT
jgi:DNA-binding NarL/FixJ family response regulator